MWAKAGLAWLVWATASLVGCAQAGVCVASSDCGTGELCSNGSCRAQNLGTPGWTENSNGPPSGGVATTPDGRPLGLKNDATHGNMVCLQSGVLDGVALTGSELNIIEMILPDPVYAAFSIVDPRDGTQVSFLTTGTLDVLPLTMARLWPTTFNASLGGNLDPSATLDALTLQAGDSADGKADLHVRYSMMGAQGTRITKDLLAHLTLVVGSPTDDVMTYSPDTGWPGSDPAALSCTPPC